MPLSDVLNRPQPFAERLTNQQIADFMLIEDRARRRALADCDLGRAAEHDREIERLASALD